MQATYIWKLRPVTLRLLDLVARVAAKMGGSAGPSQNIATLRQASAHAPAEKLLLRIVHWLRDCLGPVKKKGCDSFKRFLPDVYRTVNSIARFRPIYFANTDFPRLSFSSIAELNFEQVLVQQHGHPMKGITMPRCRLPGRKSYSPDLVISAMMQHLLIRRQFHD
jgi:hypothetical protein